MADRTGRAGNLPADSDKRDECGCHRECTVLPHECVKPCRWPACLTEDEAAAVAAEVMPGLLGGDPS